LLNHRPFKKFELTHKGAVSILFATGPSLNDFSYSGLPDVPSVRTGVNSFIYHDQYELDYYFCAHDVSKEGSGHPHNEIEKVDPIREKIKSRSSDMQVFCTCAGLRHGRRHVNDTFFSDEARREFNAIPYVVSWSGKGKEAFATSLERQPLYNQSIVFPALQFLLYTGVSKVYLVGCDCGGGVSYLSPDKEPGPDWKHATDFGKLHQAWKDFRSFAEEKYPDVDVVSVNPRGLKGMFEECYTHGV
tara:strand:- start:6472 stop:7206 length:735 start_codon:yes stop_codon:yes gene_type:complete